MLRGGGEWANTIAGEKNSPAMRTKFLIVVLLRLSIISYLLTSEENTKTKKLGLKVYSGNVRLSDRVNSREKQKRIGKSAE